MKLYAAYSLVHKKYIGNSGPLSSKSPKFWLSIRDAENAIRVKCLHTHDREKHGTEWEIIEFDLKEVKREHYEVVD